MSTEKLKFNELRTYAVKTVMAVFDLTQANVCREIC
jgi:hypothetical protein